MSINELNKNLLISSGVLNHKNLSSHHMGEKESLQITNRTQVRARYCQSVIKSD